MERTVLRRSLVLMSRHRVRGFTLIELMIVVAIVGILAILGIVGYRRYVLNSKISEAQAMISAIKIAQENYRAEKGQYLNVGQPNWCPAGAGVPDKKWGWTGTCGNAGVTWDMLPVHAETVVQFKYMTTAGIGGFTSPPDTGWVTWGAPTGPWYTATAECDLSLGGNQTILAGSSMDNHIFIQNAGE